MRARAPFRVCAPARPSSSSRHFSTAAPKLADRGSLALEMSGGREVLDSGEGAGRGGTLKEKRIPGSGCAPAPPAACSVRVRPSDGRGAGRHPRGGVSGWDQDQLRLPRRPLGQRLLVRPRPRGPGLAPSRCHVSLRRRRLSASGSTLSRERGALLLACPRPRGPCWALATSDLCAFASAHKGLTRCCERHRGRWSCPLPESRAWFYCIGWAGGAHFW